MTCAPRIADPDLDRLAQSYFNLESAEFTLNYVRKKMAAKPFSDPVLDVVGVMIGREWDTVALIVKYLESYLEAHDVDVQAYVEGTQEYRMQEGNQ